MRHLRLASHALISHNRKTSPHPAQEEKEEEDCRRRDTCKCSRHTHSSRQFHSSAFVKEKKKLQVFINLLHILERFASYQNTTDVMIESNPKLHSSIKIQY